MMNRRKLLLPLLLMPWLALPRGGHAKSRRADVIVLGAGMAGIACAAQLRDWGYSVIVLEARGRIGGRLWTDQTLGVPVDMGGAWIAGVDGNPLTALTEDAGIDTFATDWDALTMYANQRPIDRRQQAAADERFGRVMAQARAEKAKASASADLGAALTRAADAWLDDDLIGAAVRWQLWSAIESEYGEAASGLSLKSWNEDDEMPGDHVLLRQGYGALIQRLARGLDIRMNQVVQRVEHGDDGVTVRTDGGEFSAVTVVSTLPLGVLKTGTVKFDPPLPARHQQAISRLSTGALNKVVLKFPRVFWPRQTHVFARVDGDPAKRCEFYNLELLHQQPLLVALVGGAYSRALERQPDAAVVAAMVAELRAIFGPDVPMPLRATRTRWAADPYARGSYSVMPPGASLSDLAALGRAGGPRLIMAGEATVTDYPASVHGAYQSGLRAAAEVDEI